MDKLINILTNTELLLTSLSKEEWVAWAKKHQGENIFFGIGLMTHNAVSEAVPFDVLGMFFLAELLRKLVGGEKVFIVVADQHAMTNQLISTEKIEEKTRQIVSIFQSVIQTFSLEHFEIIQTTPLNFDESIKKIYRALPAIPNDYLKHEIADTIWLTRFHHVGIKLGWAMNSTRAIEGHDERFFDTEIAQFCPDVSFIHAKPGRTGDRKRPRVSPYVSLAGEERLLLDKNEQASVKLQKWREEKENLAIKPLLRHISQIVRLQEQLFSSLGLISLGEKVDTIIKKIFSE